MTWFKRKLNATPDEVIDPFNASAERQQEYAAQIRANAERNEMKAIKEERKKEEKAQEDQLVVIHGAKIKMGVHIGEFKVLNDVPTTQDKPTGTIVEKTIANFTFNDGFQLISILGDWQNYGTYQVQDNEVLIKKSTLQAMGKMPGNSPPETGNIEFMDSGQINRPENIFSRIYPIPGMEEMPPDIEEISLQTIAAQVIEVGFVKQETAPSSAEVLKKATSLPLKGSLEMGEKVFLRVKTLGLAGKKLKVEVRQAVEKQLTEKDQPIAALSAVEMTVGKITQSADSKNKYEDSDLKALENIALKEMVLEPQTEEEKKNWKAILANTKDQKIKLYFHVEVLDAKEEEEITYKGDDTNDPKNFSTQKPFELMDGENNGCLIDYDYFFEMYNLEFPKKDKQGEVLPLSENKKNSLRKMFDGINDYYSAEKRCCNLQHIAYMLATAKLETADTFNPIKEYGGTKYYQEMYDPILGKNDKRKKMAKDNGNRPGDGVIYIGRGFVQLTWRNNYIKMKEKFGVDLEKFPDKAMEHKLAIKIMIYGCETGKFAGPKLQDYINDKKTDYFNARRVINGTDKAEYIEKYAKKIEKCLKIEKCFF